MGDNPEVAMTWSKRVAPLLAVTSLAWCLLAGGTIWFGSLTYPGVSDGVAAVRERSFSEVSSLGAAPLLLPVLITAVAAWAAWRGRRAILGLSAVLLAVFTGVSGFSIGGAYVPATGLLLVAAALATGLGRSTVGSRDRA